MALTLSRVKLREAAFRFCADLVIRQPKYDPETSSLLETDFLKVEIKDNPIEIIEVLRYYNLETV